MRQTDGVILEAIYYDVVRQRAPTKQMLLYCLLKLATATKIDAIAKRQMPSGKFHCHWSKVEADVILSR